MEYASYRYLENMSDEALHKRFEAIIRNMPSYSGADRNVVPIISYQGAWYWFRKEHQTRLEFAFRELEVPKFDNLPFSMESPVPLRAKIPNGTDAIFRYGKREHLQELIVEGKVRFSPAEVYDDADNNDARKDDERQKHAYLPGKYTTITQEDGQRIPIIGDVQRSVGGPAYHLMSFSCVWDSRLFSEFEADSCIIVTNPEEFARRVEQAGRAVFPGWYFHDCPVQYFDPYERIPNEFFDAAMSKDFTYAYQNEYRVLWCQMDAAPIDGVQYVEIGPSQDIMKMYDQDGREIAF